MKIEIPSISDYDRVNELAVQVHEFHVKLRPDLFLKSNVVITEERFKELVLKNEIYVAKDNDRIVGYIIFNIVEKTNPLMRYRKQLNIENICVDELDRNKGVGTKILLFVKEFAILNNCTDLYLTVNEENKNAIKLYEKLGFKVKEIEYLMSL